MPPEQAARQQSVEALRGYVPHPSRTSTIQHWHLDQIAANDPAVAMLHIAVTAGGQVICQGLGLDPVHTQIILGELDDLRDRLAAHLAPQTAANNVIPLSIAP